MDGVDGNGRAHFSHTLLLCVTMSRHQIHPDTPGLIASNYLDTLC